MAWLASSRVTGDARLRHDGRDPSSRQSAAAKKNQTPPRQKPKHRHAVSDPLVNPGNPPHRRQTCSKANSTRACHRMVILAQGSPGRSPESSFQTKITTVMLESVREHQAGLQSFRSMRRIDARRKNASALRLRFSQSLASLRQRLSQAMVRSTTQRRGSTTNPLA